MEFRCASATDVGRKRKANEDAHRLLPDEHTWILADGMGGHVAGQVASQLAVEKIADFFTRWRHESNFVWPYTPAPGENYESSCLRTAVRIANVRIYNRGQSDEACQNMGTTVVVLTWSETAGMVIAHVGDSRCYRLRGTEFRQLTTDHSLVNHLMQVFHLSEVDAKARASSNVIVRAVGLEDDVEVELTYDRPMPGDVYLSCSDGLSDMVSDVEISDTLCKFRSTTGRIDLDGAAQALVDCANAAGGNDNITVVLVQADLS